MLKLLALRAGALFLRPAAIYLEYLLVTDGFAIVLVLPVASLALMISSVPVYRDYFRTRRDAKDYHEIGLDYVSALTIVSVAALGVLAVAVSILPLGMSVTLCAAACSTFFVEKFSDETSRALEFRKAFGSWFLVQVLRSGWLAAPIALHLIGAPYELSFLVTSVLTAIFFLVLFHRVTGLSPRFDLRGWPVIRESSAFIAGNFLPAFYQQGPRILVPRLFPDLAHIYFALAQVCQGVSLLFNVRYQIPYRQLTARRPRLFERRLRPTIARLVSLVVAVCLTYLALSGFVSADNLSGFWRAALLSPMLLNDALMFAIGGLYLGYMPWFVRPRSALTTYVMCIGALALSVSVLYAMHQTGVLTLFNLAPIFTLTGVLWYAIIRMRHFQRLKSG